MGLLSADFTTPSRHHAKRPCSSATSVAAAAEEAALGVELRVAWRAPTLAGCPADVPRRSIARW
jgi:hypothetical protein